MATTIWSDLQQRYQQGNAIMRLVMVNVAVHIAVNLVYVGCYLFWGNDPQFGTMFHKAMQDWLYFPPSFREFITRPWTIITYMFLHATFWHLLFNMLLLYLFGRILNDLIHNSKIVPLYLLSGIMGALFYSAAFYIFPVFNGREMPLVGASASAMGVMLASAVLNPRGMVRLLLLGNVELQYLALFFVFMDLLLMPNNLGGRFAHLGGDLMGWIYIAQMRRGLDLSRPFNALFALLSRPFGRSQPQPRQQRKEPQRAYRPTTTTSNTTAANTNAVPNRDSDSFPASGFSRAFMQQYRHMSQQECVDAILDKIRRSGYSSLTEDEKAFLDKTSREGKI